MTIRPIVTGLATAGMLALASCSGTDAASNASAAPTPTHEAAAPLVGTFQTDTLTIAGMKHVARTAGFARGDIAEYFKDNFPGAHDVVYTLKVTSDQWVAFVAIDGGSPEETWSGPYHVVDDRTVKAGAPPCGPITYDYALAGDQLTIKLRADDCPDPNGTVPPGELIAQTTIYQTAPFTKVG